jgi:hypothetical protein
MQKMFFTRNFNLCSTVWNKILLKRIMIRTATKAQLEGLYFQNDWWMIDFRLRSDLNGYYDRIIDLLDAKVNEEER